ncbi:MAG: hypothetical protein JWQ96_1156 [Segetibacter sp.]|nr:hypothetical protein [Segetibacter sp.]
MRLLFAVFFLLLIFSCKQKNKKETNIAATKNSLVTDHSYPKYVSFLSSLDSTNPESAGRAAREFNELFKGADKNKADSAFVLFENFNASVEKNLNEALLKDTTNYAPYAGNSSEASPKSGKAAAFVEKLRKNGYIIDLVEGSAYTRRDYNFLPAYIYPNVSTVMQQYLEQVRKEANEGFIDDAGLIIKPVDLAKRILFWEDFLAANPSFIYAGSIKESQRSFVTFLLEGIDNTPLLEYGSTKLNLDFKEAFEYVLKEAPQSNLANLVRPYYAALQAKNNSRLEGILKDYRKRDLIFSFED